MKRYIITLVLVLLQVSLGYSDDRAPITAKKTERDLGRIIITRTDVNPENQTRLVFESCGHPGIGELKNCNGYIYDLTPEGWIKPEPARFDQSGSHTILLAAGKHYMKIQSYQAKSYYASGEIVLAPFVTNFVHVDVE